MLPPRKRLPDQVSDRVRLTNYACRWMSEAVCSSLSLHLSRVLILARTLSSCARYCPDRAA